MPMNSFLIIVTVFLSTQSQFTKSPNSLLSLLSTNNETRLETDCHKSNILRLAEDVVISSSMQIRSEEITLIGNSSKLIFQHDIQPSSEQSSWSPNEASTMFETKNTPKVGSEGYSSTSFLFEVFNSTFSVSEVHAILNSDRNGLCSVAGSTVRFWSSSITSTGDLSPFMITTSENEGPTLGSTVILAYVTHHSISAHVAPFVGLTHPQHPLVSPRAVKRGDGVTRKAEWITIVGTGLWLESKDLISGTGPLFTFGLSEQGSSFGASGCGLRMETSLVGSTLVNMTSSSRMSLGNQQFGSGVSQRVIGSCVQKCTNHDSGTGMMSPNLGGNVMCLNTSFSSCIRTGNEDKDFQNKNFTQTSDPGRLSSVAPDVTSVSYTLCTFNTMTLMSGDGLGGSVLYLTQTSSSLSIDTCFFHKCTCPRNGDDGGVLVFMCDWNTRFPLTISNSSFTECAADDSAGCLSVYFPSSVTINFCFFEQAKADGDSAAHIESTIISVSNTAFVECTSRTNGALTINMVQTLLISFCQFRQCSSQDDSDGRDIYTYGPSTDFTPKTIPYCDSTSGEPNVYCYTDRHSSSTFVPQIETVPTVRGVDITVEDDKATVVVETEEEINGTISILLKGSNVPRLVHVVFGDPETDTKFGTVVVSSGPDGILPDAPYTHYKWTLIPFPPPTVLTVDSSLEDWNTTEIVVSGVSLKTGTYRMEVENGEEKHIITLTRWNFTTLTGTAPLYPSTAAGRLEWATEYKVTKVMWIPKDKQAEEEVTLWDTITFTTPAEPPRIEGAGCSLNGLKDVVIVELNGRALSSSDLIVVISGTSGPISSSGGLFNVTSTKCFVNFSIGLSEDSSHVMFGGHYDLLSVGSGSSSLVVNSGLFIDVPHPPRIASIVVPEEVTTSTFDLSASGSNLPSGKTYTVTLSTDLSFEMSFSSAIAGTSTVKIGGSGNVQYNTEYTIKSIILSEDQKDNEHILFSELTFKTPRGPTLSSISCEFDSSDPDYVKVSFSTERMPVANFKLAVENVDSPSETVELTITSSDLSSEFVVVKVYEQTGTLKYGTNYRVMKMWSGNLVAVLANPLFSTPPEPIRITEADCSLGGDQEKSALVTLKGIKLGGGKEFNVTVRKLVGSAASGEDILLSGTLSGAASSTEHIHSVEIFGVSNAPLSYDTNYLITHFDVKDSISTVDADATFIVPAEPSRLTSLDASLQYSADKKSATISLLGIGMEGDYNLTLSVNSNPLNNVTLTATFDAAGRGVATAVLFDLSDPPIVNLSYNTRYEVVDVTKASTPVWFENDLVFTTIAIPARLVSISVGEYAIGMDFVELSFGSIALPSEETFTLTLESVHSDGTTPHQKVFILETDGSGELARHHAQLYPFETDSEKRKGQLEFDTKYKVVRFTIGSSTIHFEDIPTRIQTPTEPARIEKCTHRMLNAARTELVVSLEGRKLRANLGFLSLSAESGSWTSIGEIEADDETHCSVLFSAASTESATHIKFGKEYVLKTISADETNFVVNDGIRIVVPFPPKITNITFSLSNNLSTGCIVVLTGKDLIVGNSLNVTMNESLSFITTITSETEAKSSEQQIGWPNTLKHNTEYTITSIEAMNEADGTTLFDSPISNTTGSLPDDIVIFVDSGSSSESSLFCGDRTRPCSTIEDGWKVVEGVGISTFSISILHNTTQTEQVKILSHQEVVIESGPSTKPELFVSPSSSSSALEGEGMVEVCGGRLWIHQVDIALSDSPSLIFIRMVGGHLTIETCSLVGPKGTQTSSNIESSNALCEWDTGALILEDSTTTITSTRLTHLSSGAINMKGGNLTISSSSFDSNTPHSSSFPSLRHNIRCSEGGEIEVGSLNGGDGMETPSAWISASDCLLTAKEAITRSPFFIPTLSSSSTSKLNKTEKAFVMTVHGATLIPCSLMLEVFEKKKDGKEGLAKPFPLTEDSTTSFNDTTIVVSLPLSSLSSFDDSLEWRGRLKIASSDGQLKWWLPLVISLVLLFVIMLVVVIVCCRRRKAVKNIQQDAELNETDPIAMEDEKVEIVTDNRIGVNSIHSLMSSESNKSTEMKEPEPSDDLSLQNVEEVLVCSGDMKTTAFVSKDRTLYNALHSEKKWDVRVRQAQQQLVEGLKGVWKKDREAAILRALTAHNILFDSKENVCLKLNLDLTPLPISTQHQTEHTQREQEPAVETNESKQAAPPLAEPVNEGVRWFAPEVIANKSNVNSVHGAVFSLGLILWEMETGCVPFGEQDAVNASRQIVTGVQPKLELVKNDEMRELISQCLSLEPVDRPDLESIENTLILIPAEKSIAPNAFAQC
ncbi:hypothetical protein BLNAU_3194 [Blattamonas nauphoetae]|uniref:Protein kinase domain-containing protein n=1 Tax=Blattamonas nauphoetae TaxID=2049346 RepID=A0ABQ9YDC1_9EUKA|nr:hypothetical protein BLNAU_3194 [Blattamonas nauphoetae]